MLYIYFQLKLKWNISNSWSFVSPIDCFHLPLFPPSALFLHPTWWCFIYFYFFLQEPSGAKHESDFLDHLYSPQRSVQSLHRHDGPESHDSLPPGNWLLPRGDLRWWDTHTFLTNTHIKVNGQYQLERIIAVESRTFGKPIHEMNL